MGYYPESTLIPREKSLKKLNEIVQNSKSSITITAVVGGKKIGKTAFVTNYIYQQENIDLVCYVDAQHTESIRADYIELACALSDNDTLSKSDEARKAAENLPLRSLKNFIRGKLIAKGMKFIFYFYKIKKFDQEVFSCIPEGDNNIKGQIILEVEKLNQLVIREAINIIRVPAFDLNEAVTLLDKIYSLPEQKHDAKLLCEFLGCQPEDIHNAVIEMKDMNIMTYEGYLGKRKAKNPQQYQKLMATTLKENDVDEKNILGFCANLEIDYIPTVLFSILSINNVEKFLASLVKKKFLTAQTDDTGSEIVSYNFNQQYKEYILKEKEQYKILYKSWCEDLAKLVSLNHPLDILKHSLKFYLKILPCLKNLEKKAKIYEATDSSELAILQMTIADIYYYLFKDLKKAEIYYKKTETTFADNLKYSKHLSHIFNSLGEILRHKGKFQEAIEAHQKALKILDNSLDSKTELAVTYIQLATVYRETHQVAKAEEACVFAGNMVPDNSIFKIDITYIQGKISFEKNERTRAITLFQQVLDIAKEIYVKNPIFLMPYLNSLARVYIDETRLEDARALCNESIKLHNQIYGDNVNTFHKPNSYTNLGLSYLNEDSGEAIKNFNAAKEIWIEIYGAKHPYIADCYDNLAICAQRNKEYTQAINLYLKAYNIRKEFYGKKHLKVGHSMYKLAQCYSEKENGERQAKQYFENAITIYTKENSSLAVNCLCELAVLCIDRSKLEMALRYYQKALALSTEIPGVVNATTEKITEEIESLDCAVKPSQRNNCYLQ